MMLLTDGALSFQEVFFLVNKESLTTFKAFKIFLTRAELQTGKCLHIVRMDGGSEFYGPWLPFCEEKGIIIETMPPYSSSANGVAK